MIEHPTWTPEFISKYIKPGITMWELLGEIDRNRMPRPKTLSGFAEELVMLRFRGLNQASLREELIHVKSSGQQKHVLPISDIEDDQKRQYKIVGVLHEAPSGETNASAIEEIKKYVREKADEELKDSDRLVLVEEGFTASFGLNNDCIELPDQTNFSAELERQGKLASFVERGDLENLLETMNIANAKGVAQRYMNGVSSDKTKLLTLGKLCMVADYKRRRNYLQLKYPNMFSLSKTIEDELLNCKNLNELGLMLNWIENYRLPEPLNMEISYILSLSPEDTISTGRDFIIDRSLIQARSSRWFLDKKEKEKTTIFVGYGHVNQTKWFLQHPEYHHRTSLEKAERLLAVPIP